MNLESLTHTHTTPSFPAESFLSASDLTDFQEAHAAFNAGRWHEDRWKTFRLRFGIYEQRQKGQHMVRLKVPGGRLNAAQARAIAEATRLHTGGSIHITTRQAIQLYFVTLNNLPALLQSLHAGGVTTREASGGTLRNTTACLGCAKAKVDAGHVADGLARSWLRHPLVQHLPRKVKTTVSGCEADCGLSAIDDLGFIATERYGQPGFRVVMGGGLGTHPRTAVEVFGFVEEKDLPAVQEAMARIHHRHSKRADKNRSRLKFLVDRFGAETFAKKVQDEYEKIQDLPRRPWETATVPADASKLVVEVPLGVLSPDQLDAIADAADQGNGDILLTRNQNAVLTGLEEGAGEDAVSVLRAHGLDASGRRHALEDFVACFGSSTCAIGITDANALAHEVLDSFAEFEGVPALRLRISGCHNSCGHHHIADIGLHGVAKKIEGKPAPHYQVHLGGSAEAHGILGPVVPAKRAREVLVLLVRAYIEGRKEGEGVRGWAERLGKAGIEAVVSPALEASARDLASFAFDVQAEHPFSPPATATGECAAGAVVAEHLDDLGRVALENVARALSVDKRGDAIAYAALALHLPAQRLLTIAGEHSENGDGFLGQVKALWSRDAKLVSSLAKAEAASDAFAAGEDWADAAPAIEAWQQAARDSVEDILSGVAGFLRKGAA